MTPPRLLSALAAIAVVSSLTLPAMAAVQTKTSGAQISSSSSSQKSQKKTNTKKKPKPNTDTAPTSEAVVSLAAGVMCTYEKQGLCDVFHCDDGSTLNTCNLVRDAIKQKTEYWYGADGLSFRVQDSDNCELKYKIHPNNHDRAEVQYPLCPKYQPNYTSSSGLPASSCVEIPYMTIPGTPFKKGMSLCTKMCPGKPPYVGMCS